MHWAVDWTGRKGFSNAWSTIRVGRADDGAYLEHNPPVQMWTSATHILEMKMVKAELQDLVMQDCTPARHVLLVDSRVCAGAWSKGRSSSKQLNQILRQMLGWALVGQKSLHLVWVRAEKNPADHPSRGCKMPEPHDNTPISSKLFGSSNPEFRNRLSNRKIHQIDKKRVSDDAKCQPFAVATLKPDSHPAVSQ